MATISARVPDEVRRQGLSRLRAQGATVSDLVNAAFDYLIQTGELPGRVSKGQERRGPLDACSDGLLYVAWVRPRDAALADDARVAGGLRFYGVLWADCAGALRKMVSRRFG